jgi:hypothetical protein
LYTKCSAGSKTIHRSFNLLSVSGSESPDCVAAMLCSKEDKSRTQMA